MFYRGNTNKSWPGLSRPSRLGKHVAILSEITGTRAFGAAR